MSEHLAALKQQLLANYAWVEGHSSMIENRLVVSFGNDQLCVILEKAWTKQIGLQSAWLPYDKDATNQAKTDVIITAVLGMLEVTAKMVHDKRMSMIWDGQVGAAAYEPPH